MTSTCLCEVGRQYQAILEARRAAVPLATDHEAEDMGRELARAQGALEAAWLRHTVEGG